jgi:hypothetical protein
MAAPIVIFDHVTSCANPLRKPQAEEAPEE